MITENRVNTGLLIVTFVLLAIVAAGCLKEEISRATEMPSQVYVADSGPQGCYKITIFRSVGNGGSGLSKDEFYTNAAWINYEGPTVSWENMAITNIPTIVEYDEWPRCP